MNSTNGANRKKLWSTRNPSWFPVDAFYEDTVILNDGTLVAVLEVIPLDMALMARDESEAVLGRFWQGIKGLPFPVAVYLGRRRQDVAGYLTHVEDRLNALAEAGQKQEDFYGRLLEEHLRLVKSLLSEHVRSRYALLAVYRVCFQGLSTASRLLSAKKSTSGWTAKLDQEQIQRSQEDLEMNVKRVEDLLRRVGLKHARYTGIELAVEVARLCRPGVSEGNALTTGIETESPAVIGGAMEEGAYVRVTSLEG